MHFTASEALASIIRDNSENMRNLGKADLWGFLLEKMIIHSIPEGNGAIFNVDIFECRWK